MKTLEVTWPVQDLILWIHQPFRKNQCICNSAPLKPILLCERKSLLCSMTIPTANHIFALL
uniref:Uncharacterized protein n=1 Tax=Arundo donax TaxID=35708 RepID=A0A0A9C1Y1_ARUDO